MNYAKKTLVYFVGHTAIGIIALLFVLFNNYTEGYRQGAISGIVTGFIVIYRICFVLLKKVLIIIAVRKSAYGRIFSLELGCL